MVWKHATLSGTGEAAQLAEQQAYKRNLGKRFKQQTDKTRVLKVQLLSSPSAQLRHCAISSLELGEVNGVALIPRHVRNIGILKMLRRLNGQDISLSRIKSGFKTRWSNMGLVARPNIERR